MVLFLDSGVGGLVYLEEFRRRSPGVPTLYIADTGMFPYGDRDPAVVRDRVAGLVAALVREYPVDAVVLACNTASVVALEAVRSSVEVPVVGTVPAVKPAAAATESGDIAILATQQTATDPYTDDLVAQFARFATVHRIGLPHLVTAAEEYFCSGDETAVKRLIREEVREVIPGRVDTVVLACTHFVRFRDQFAAILGPGVRVVDSLDGVTRRLIAVLGPRGVPRHDHDPHPILLHTGGTGAATLTCDTRWRPLDSVTATSR